MIRSNKKSRLAMYTMPGGAYCMLHLSNKDFVLILYLYVPEEQRNNGVGTTFIKSIMCRAYKAGYRRILCNFPSMNKAMLGLIQKTGFTIKPDDQLITVNISDILESEKSEKLFDAKSDSTVESLAYLMPYELSAVDKLFKKLSYLHMNTGEMLLIDLFDESLSFIGYNDNYRPVSMLLASVHGDTVLVEYLLGVSNRKTKYVLAVCRQFLSELKNNPKYSEITKLSMVAINPAILPLLSHVMDDTDSLIVDGQICYCTYALTEQDGSRSETWDETDADSFTETDEEFFEELDSMEALDSYQGNINIKTYWKRVLSEVIDPSKRKTS